ncbi:MAG: hypothetical protein K2X77_13390 [Candidatus Obscuribacterales bacterium]|jgi:hypothetical protein|nr:hypothetical protein [Candidatus Obscuribacterales bacterium]
MRILLLLLFLTLSALPIGAETGTSTFTGYLVDRDAVQRTSGKINLELTRNAYHRNKAAISRVGFGLLSNGQLYEFDAHGNNLAKLLVTNSHNEQPLMVMIRGSLIDGQIRVEQLSDVSVQQF